MLPAAAVHGKACRYPPPAVPVATSETTAERLGVPLISVVELGGTTVGAAPSVRLSSRIRNWVQTGSMVLWYFS